MARISHELHHNSRCPPTSITHSCHPIVSISLPENLHTDQQVNSAFLTTKSQASKTWPKGPCDFGKIQATAFRLANMAHIGA